MNTKHLLLPSSFLFCAVSFVMASDLFDGPPYSFVDGKMRLNLTYLEPKILPTAPDKIKEHMLNDERIQYLVTYPGLCEYFGRRTNKKLTSQYIIESHADKIPLFITRSTYRQLVSNAEQEIRNLKIEGLYWGAQCGFYLSFCQIYNYLYEGYALQTYQKESALRAQIPFFTWAILKASANVGVELPRDVGSIILKHLLTVSDDEPYSIFKTDALLMLRYTAGLHERKKEEYKKLYNFPPALDALW